MTERASYFRIGLFVVVSMLLLIASLALLGGLHFRRQFIVAETYMRESVLGLDVGARVLARGVPAGRVSAINFVNDVYDLSEIDPSLLTTPSGEKIASWVVVRMEINVRPNQSDDETREQIQRLIKAGMRARMSREGLVGASYIALLDASVLDSPAFEPPLDA